MGLDYIRDFTATRSTLHSPLLTFGHDQSSRSAALVQPFHSLSPVLIVDISRTLYIRRKDNVRVLSLPAFVLADADSVGTPCVFKPSHHHH
jgi:hypothetical protein